MGIKTWWAEPTALVEVTLRRLSTGSDDCAASPWKCHTGQAVIHAQAPRADWLTPHEDDYDVTTPVAADDPRWPENCEWCGTPLKTSTSQVNAHTLYQGSPDGVLYTLRNLPVGGMYDADWFVHEGRDSGYTGADGITLVCVTPGGIWMVDSQASNCTRPQRRDVPGKQGYSTFERTHYCWVRHGDPRTGRLHVDKNGDTCSAGAGSIIAGNWHGFLHHGELTP